MIMLQPISNEPIKSESSASTPSCTNPDRPYPPEARLHGASRQGALRELHGPQVALLIYPPFITFSIRVYISPATELTT